MSPRGWPSVQWNSPLARQALRQRVACAFTQADAKGTCLSSAGIAFRLGGKHALDPVGNALCGWQHDHGPTMRHTGNGVGLCLGGPEWLA